MRHTEFWAPGTLLETEYPHRVGEMVRRGWGTFVKQVGGFNWFHFPITTPYILNGHTFVVVRVFVFFRATNGPIITNIDVYSGSRRVAAFEDLFVTGDQTEILDGGTNCWTLEPPKGIDAGLGISVRVDFGRGGEILFTGAGGHFSSDSE